ncbi:PREDICTED: actin-related protein 5 [Drosophila arizonae]|uniref:Actin-related protein 5 n=1 Tax=Drosophila arizonae TaxID=7263 RepID=A0ABM1NMT0_DROAR|nr:PREDICTED: actin-related protein 5 [Drosophila arizonae]
MAVSKRSLIIDNGSYECRVGWNNSKKPDLRFRNVLTKPRKDRKKDCNQMPDSSAAPATPVDELKANAEIQIGNDITNIEAVRAHLKSPFERNVITNWNHQEHILDYIFSKMGFDGETSIDYPIVLTEALANPNPSRRQMSELLFECYSVPAVSYGIDALYSWHHHQQQHKKVVDALIISFGYSTTHVIPVLGGKMQLQHVRRLNVGGFHINNYLFRLMQMKYPVHLNAISSRIEKLVHEHCHIAQDYKEELMKWAQLDYYEAHVMKIQLPYNQVTATNALLTAEQKQEKRRELALRLLDIKNRREREKLQEDEDYLQVLRKLRQLYEQQKLQKFERALQQQQIANLEELDKLLGTITARIKRVKERATAQPKPSKQQDKLDKLPKPPEGVPQAQWLADLREKRDQLQQRKQARQQQRQEQAKRHTHAAQERMRIISTLARSEKRRKANGGDEEDDGFGMNDNDWDVYKRINRYNDDSDSDAENEQMLEYEKILQHYDANFDDGSNNAAMQALIAAENYQLHFGVEAIRVPEILFQPSMIGCTEAGLAELIAFVLKLFTSEEQQRLVDHVYLTGSCAQFRGLKERLAKELLELRPFQSSFAIYESNEPMLGAWLGACLQANGKRFSETLITRQLYQEHGGEYLKEHSASNLFYPTPKD